MFLCKIAVCLHTYMAIAGKFFHPGLPQQAKRLVDSSSSFAVGMFLLTVTNVALLNYF